MRFVLCDPALMCYFAGYDDGLIDTTPNIQQAVVFGVRMNARREFIMDREIPTEGGPWTMIAVKIVGI